VTLDVRRGTELAVRLNREHRDRAAAVVGDQRVLSRRMDAHVGGPAPSELTLLSGVNRPVVRSTAYALTDPAPVAVTATSFAA